MYILLYIYIYIYIYTVQLRCYFTLVREQFTLTLEPFTPARIELLMASVLLYPRATHA